jgi:hypothetical protein
MDTVVMMCLGKPAVLDWGSILKVGSISCNGLEACTRMHGVFLRGARTSGVGAWLSLTPLNQPSTTVMRFSVSVPVLSLQMAVAPPMVSHAASTRTKLLSCTPVQRRHTRAATHAQSVSQTAWPLQDLCWACSLLHLDSWQQGVRRKHHCAAPTHNKHDAALNV